MAHKLVFLVLVFTIVFMSHCTEQAEIIPQQLSDMSSDQVASNQSIPDDYIIDLTDVHRPLVAAKTITSLTSSMLSPESSDSLLAVLMSTLNGSQPLVHHALKTTLTSSRLLTVELNTLQALIINTSLAPALDTALAVSTHLFRHASTFYTDTNLCAVRNDLELAPDIMAAFTRCLLAKSVGILVRANQFAARTLAMVDLVHSNRRCGRDEEDARPDAMQLAACIVDQSAKHAEIVLRATNDLLTGCLITTERIRGLVDEMRQCKLGLVASLEMVMLNLGIECSN